MTLSEGKKVRLLDIFFRAMKGEFISVKSLAVQYGVSTKSISRDINEIKNFLSESRELVGNTELIYSPSNRAYYLEFDNFLLNKELIAIIEIMIGCRAFNKEDTLKLVDKLKNFTTSNDKALLEECIIKELYHYKEVNHDCKSVIDNIWQLTKCINKHIEISVDYYKSDRTLVKRKIKPIAITFSDYYFYLIAYISDKDDWKPIYYRIDRIINITEHRSRFKLKKEHSFDEGELRNKIQYMFPGIERKIKFSYEGPSVQAILDKLPTAKIVGVEENKKIIEAEIYGTGINMFLLSQGSKVKVLEPKDFVEEFYSELENMLNLYK